MTIQDLKIIADVESELIGGAGPGTGEAVQLAQQFAKENFGIPVPRFINFLQDQPNGWGKLVSTEFSKYQ